MNERTAATCTNFSTARFVLLILISLFAVSRSYAEPLGYVARPDRGDLGVFDTRSNSVYGKIALGAPASVVKVHPSGEFAYVGIFEGFMGRLHTLDGNYNAFDSKNPSNSPLEGVIDIVFDSAQNRAYTVNDFGVIAVMDTQSHAVVEQWNVQFRPTKLALGSNSRWLVIGVEVESLLVLFDTATGARFEVYLPFPGIIKDFAIGGDGRLYVLSNEVISSFRLADMSSGQEVSAQEILSNLRQFPLDDLTDDAIRSKDIINFEVSLPSQVIYLGHDFGVVAIRCYIRDPVERVAINCLDTFTPQSGQTIDKEVDMIDMGRHAFSSGRHLEVMSDLQQTSDGASLYAIGRRVVVVVDSTNLEATNVGMQAGGGFLGNMSLAQPVEACVPNSTSVAGLILEIKFLDAQEETVSALLVKAKKVRAKLASHNTIGGRNALKALINTLTWRSSLSPSDARHLTPDDASDLVCAAGNLLARLDAY